MNYSLFIVLGVCLLAVLALLFVPTIPQDLNYHDFADKRALFGIPNFGDVIGNAPFTVFGLMGLWFIWRSNADSALFHMPGERLLWKLFFVGAALVGLGSAYYHWAPDNASLVWDRLPMTLAFMSFFALVIMERVHQRVALLMAPILILLGAGSVFYWNYTESLGHGDLRPYALVQFLPLLLIPIMFWLFPARYTGLKYLGYTVGWYVLAKVLEHFDKAIFTLSDALVSGHTLKHVAASFGVYTMLLYVRNRTVHTTNMALAKK